MNKHNRDAMWIVAAMFGTFGAIATILLHSFAFILLFLLAILFFVIGLVIDDSGLV